MEMRTLGRTGVKVSPLCLGAMMFGAWGNPDHDDSIRIIHAALDAGINFVDTADVYSRGESEEIVGKALAGAGATTSSSRPRSHGAMGADPNQQGNSRRWLVREVENSLRRLQTDHIDLYQIHRPDPGHRHRRDPRRAHRPGSRGQDPLLRLLDVPGRPRSWRRSGPPSSGAAGASSPSSRRTRCWCAASRPTCCRPASSTAWASLIVEPAGRRLAVRQVAHGPGRAPTKRARRAASPAATTSPARSTSASSTPPTHSPGSPRRPG